MLARYTLAGDATLDGQVDFFDLVRLAQNYGTTVSATTGNWWTHGDFTYDGIVGFNDLVKVAQNYNLHLLAGPPVASGATGAFEADLGRAFASAPEPGALVAAPVLVAALARRRRAFNLPASRPRAPS